MNVLRMMTTPGEHKLPPELNESTIAFLRKARDKARVLESQKAFKVGMEDIAEYFSINDDNNSIVCYKEGLDFNKIPLMSYCTFLVVDAYVDMIRSGERKIRVDAPFNVKSSIDYGLLDSFRESIKMMYLDGAFAMIVQDGTSTLSNVVDNAMKIAIAEGRAQIEEPQTRLPSIRAYVSMLSKKHSESFTVECDDDGNVFIALKHDSPSVQWEEMLKSMEPWGNLVIPMDQMNYSANYFRNIAKAVCPPGSEFIIKVQPQYNRILVLRTELYIAGESNIAMGRVPKRRLPFDPEWDDSEAFDDDPAETDFEIENDEIL